MTVLKEGQRWISEAEPELGLGTLVQIAAGRVHILFPAAGELRQYSLEHAPLKRVQFRAGDTVQTHDGQSLVVVSVRDDGGLLTYVGQGREVPETQLSDRLSFDRPEDRLLSGQVDDVDAFRLRCHTLQFRHHCRQAIACGLVGGRINLIPHQLYIAHEVSSRQAPRVLLADEVGLGKTIEAGLILHRLLLHGRIARVLVLVPESLVHQWFVEMLRRFNVTFRIFDEERCAAIEAGNPDATPFLDDQLILCSIGLLAASARRAEQARAAGWDLLIVDEAHHLEWHPDQVSPEYALVESLSRQAEGLLLLTATPEQLGPESHFARLRLLDPNRYGDFERYQQEAGQYRVLADVVTALHAGKRITKALGNSLKRLFPEEAERLDAACAAARNGEAAARRELMDDLLDRHGPGRVVFRNTRAAMSGFPKRLVHLVPLTARTDHAEWVDRLSTEFAVDAGDTTLTLPLDLAQDPRVIWLARLLRKLDPQKVLLICRSPEKVLAIEHALRLQLNVLVGIFHERLTLIQRDRNAAGFAEADGARLLICSEIGSEGRNFQFAHHLVLFDLPLNPELLEQRIGRLDRIGQTQDIHVHVPYLSGSPQEVLSHWYHEGLDAFATNLEGGNELLQQFGRQVHDLALEYPAAEPAAATAELAALVQQTASARTRLRKRLEQGRDRLLELNSFRPESAQAQVTAIQREDTDGRLEEFMLDVFEQFGVQVEARAPRTYHLSAHGVLTDAFPAIPEDGAVVTFDRARALAREDVGFLTWDHPMVTGAMDLVLGRETGNSSFAVLPDPAERTLLLEAWFVLETVADGKLHVDRFLPATPLRLVINHKRAEVTDQYPTDTLEPALQKGSPFKLLDNPDLSQNLLPAMVTAAHRTAEKRARSIIAESLQTMTHLLEHELARLKTLQQINDHVRPREIQLAEHQQQNLAGAIQNARLRLDAVRLIWKGPPPE